MNHLLEELKATIRTRRIRSTSKDEGIEVRCTFDLIANIFEHWRKSINLAMKVEILLISDEQHNKNGELTLLYTAFPTQHPTEYHRFSTPPMDVHDGRYLLGSECQ